MKSRVFALFSVHLIVTLFVALPSQAQTVNFSNLVPTYGGRALYVSELGNDTNSGDSTRRPLRTLQRAADMARAGDTIWVMNGVYTTPGPASTVLFITTSGTPDSWIRYRALPGHKPVIRVERNWGAITIAGARYIEITGLEIEGNRKRISLAYARTESENLNNPTTSGNGISVTSHLGQIPHHILIRNCHVHDCCGGGIATENADYVRIENNIVHHNAFFSPYAQSGISMYLNANSDNFTGIKMIVRGNTCYENFNYIPSFFSGATPQDRVISDGNGIIIDDTRNVHNDALTLPYLGTTVVSSNVVYDNGGRGILVYSSDNVLVTNNTSFGNSRFHRNRSDLLINKSSNIVLLRNMILPRPGRIELEVRETTGFRVFN